MLRLLLVCGAGMSSSLLVKYTQKAADEMGLEATVWAVPDAQVPQQVGKCDVCLVGPQIRFNIPRITKALAPVPVEMVEMTGSEKIVYFNLNGAKCSAKVPLNYDFDDFIELRVSTKDMYFFDKNTEENLLYC